MFQLFKRWGFPLGMIVSAALVGCSPPADEGLDTSTDTDEFGVMDPIEPVEPDYGDPLGDPTEPGIDMPEPTIPEPAVEPEPPTLEPPAPEPADEPAPEEPAEEPAPEEPADEPTPEDPENG